MNKLIRIQFHENLYFYDYRHDLKRYSTFHAHEGIEILYVHSGVGELILNHRTYPLAPGCLVLLQPYQLHNISIAIDADQPYIRTVCMFNPLPVDDHLKSFPMARAFFQRLWKGSLSEPVIRIPSSDPLIAKFAEFHDTLQLSERAHRKEHFILFIMAVMQSLRLFVEYNDKTHQNDPRKFTHTERIMEWIERHFKRQVSLDLMAEQLHLSPFYLSHLFKETTGKSITDYIIARRIDEAFKLLSSTSLSMKEIADRIGVRNATYFCQFFKKHTGLTPGQYRNSYPE
ncbi:AraC family transcriptional regulator [Cohnella sp. GCM10027633]|uniref:AraC family transcriptional regulator n=1 Tax=unclassified Cohnella TaxID=2636738 RepID=UPI00363B0DAE